LKNKKKVPEISIIIPCYNLENIVKTTVKNILENLEKFSDSFEILIVNDGSTDNTLEVIQDIKNNHECIHVITYSQNKGKGYAVKTGILQSIGSYIVFIDGDLDITSDAIQNYIEELNNFDLVIGSKSLQSSEIEIRQSRKILSDIFSSIVKFLTGLKIQDTQVGFKVGNGEDLRKIFKIMNIDGFAFDVELLVIATKLNLRIKEMPVKLKIMKSFRFNSAVQMFYDVLKITYNYKILHKFDH
jgi:dolichol-phosphate mannosyltransferase